MKKQEIATVELLMSKEVCRWNLFYVQILYPKFDGVMDDSMNARLTYHLYADPLGDAKHLKNIWRCIRAVEVICKDKRVRIRATKGKLFDQYLRAYPVLMKLKPILEAGDE